MSRFSRWHDVSKEAIESSARKPKARVMVDPPRRHIIKVAISTFQNPTTILLSVIFPLHFS
jgi:hypothetical protein